MHYYKKLFNAFLLGALLAGLFAASAHADGISVNKVEIRLGEDGYQLSASYDINLNLVVKQALSHGIPIYFVGEFSLTHARWDWLDTAKQAVWRTLPHFFIHQLIQSALILPRRFFRQ